MVLLQLWAPSDRRGVQHRGCTHGHSGGGDYTSWPALMAMAASSRQEAIGTACVGISGLSKSGWHQTAAWEAPEAASDRRNSSFLHNLLLPVEIFSMEENDILCFLNWEIALGAFCLCALIERGGLYVLLAEELVWESPPANMLLARTTELCVIPSQLWQW